MHMQDASYAAFEKESKAKRMKRLTALLDKSSLYSDFLAKRMESQAEQQKKKDARAEKRAENANVRAEKGAVAAPVDRSTRGGGGAAAGAAAAAAAAAGPNVQTKRRKSPAKKGKSAAALEPEEPDEVEQGSSTVGAPSKRRRVGDDGEAAAGSDDEEEGPVQPALFTGGELRKYQLAGMEWMAALYENGLNGILADEMGLGKTAQCIALIAHLYAMKVPGPYLVVGPLSTLPNWQSEFARFTPDLPVILYHGTPEDRAEKRKRITQLGKSTIGLPVVITSYEIVIRDAKELRKVPWKYIVVDEGHRLKNMNCRLIRELKTYNTANRLLLTGTPLQNNLSELWSLLNFLLPDIFDDLAQFQRWFDFDGVGEDGVDARILEEQMQEQIAIENRSLFRN